VEDHGQICVAGCAVGVSFAVLVAEQMFASGCQLQISVTSAGQIAKNSPTPYFILIDKALRDEGASHHYLSPPCSPTAPTWTTDAPYREKEVVFEYTKIHGALPAEMEAAALYPFAEATRRDVIYLVYVTNAVAQAEGDDVEKGEVEGSIAVAKLAEVIAEAWSSTERKRRRRSAMHVETSTRSQRKPRTPEAAEQFF
jgi:uridine phosphorylase